MALSEYEVRKQKVETLRGLGINPYAQKYDKRHTIQHILSHEKDAFRDVEEIIFGPKSEYSTAGRLTLFRTHGKLSFGKLLDESGEIQLMFHKDNCRMHIGDIFNSDDIGGIGMTAYKVLEKLVDVGDFIGVEGELFMTHKGELTLFVSNFTFLAKAIQPLGDKFHGIGEDQEKTYRQRYLDMIFNRETLERIKLRSKFTKTIRDFYHTHGFLELETPVLGNSASGAAAKPFVTHHNDFDIDMYLHISDETSLKKATVGMLERVFEIGKDFRNEGSDPSHQQEFTMIEHYAAYWNHEDNMRFTEEMFDYIFTNVPELKKTINVTDKQGITKEVSFQTPWQRIDYIDQIQKDSGINVAAYREGDDEKLRSDIKAAGHTREGMDKQGLTTMIDYLYKKVTRPKIVGPAFIVNYPKLMQPLARISDADKNIVEQWQLLVNGWEVIKAYSELVDPVQQQANFDAQAGALAAGDEEATAGDPEFVQAMEYGMPPQSGWGMGVDRILALLTEQSNIRDVILFPMMKPEGGVDNTHDKKESLKLAAAIVNTGVGLEPWQIANTIAHLTAAFGARGGKSLISQDQIFTQDQEALPLNIQHAIIIREAHGNSELYNLYKEASAQGLQVSIFTKEMLDSTNDNKIKEVTAGKSLSTIEILGLLVYGKKESVETITKEFSLFKAFSAGTPKEAPAAATEQSYDNMPSVADAKGLADKYLTDTRQHCEQVGKVMHYFAKKLNQDQDTWYIAGLLHDVDRDHVGKDMHKHVGAEFEKIAGEINLPEALMNDIRSHYHEKTGVPVDLLIRKYLISVDELSGFLYAYSLLRPEGFVGMDAKGVFKRMKDKKFAAGVNRDHVKYCEEYLGIPLEEFIPEVIKALAE